MRLDASDEVIGMAIVNGDSDKEQLLTVTQNGYGKRTLTEEYRIQGRGGSGIMTMKITEKNGPIVAVRQVADEDELILASDKGKVIRTRVSEISEVGRVAQGVRLMNLEEGEQVAAVAKIVEKEEEETPAGNA
jgi:DNA gyrase subunit A